MNSCYVFARHRQSRVWAVFAFLVLAVLCTPNRSFADDYDGAFTKIWQVARDHFYDPNMNGVDWKSVGDTYRSKLGTVTNNRSFVVLMNEMLGTLHASHTHVYGPDDFEFYLLPELQTRSNDPAHHQKFYQIGTLEQDAKPNIVAGVLDGSPAADAGLHSGDKLISVNGVAYHGLTQFQAAPVDLAIERDGKKSVVHLTPISDTAEGILLKATQKSIHIIPEPDGRLVGYIHLWSMTGWEELNAMQTAVLGALHDTDGLILDLREGFGGSFDGYPDVFFHPEVSLSMRTREHPAEQVFQQGYSKPMVVLTDNGTRSAKEILTWTLKTSHRATIVGQKTTGAVLALRGFSISNTIYLSLAIEELKFNGIRLEGQGVTPDIAIPNTPSDADYLKHALAVMHGLTIHTQEVKHAINAPQDSVAVQKCHRRTQSASR